jgi:hypothetical protein
MERSAIRVEHGDNKIRATGANVAQAPALEAVMLDLWPVNMNPGRGGGFNTVRNGRRIAHELPRRSDREQLDFLQDSSIS